MQTYGQERPFLFKVDYPDYVPKNNSFEISVVTRTTDPKCDDIHFFVLVDKSVQLEDVVYIDDIIKKKIHFEESDFHDFYGKAYRVAINLDSLGLTHDIFYQLILKLKAYDKNNIKVAFGFECLYPNQEVKVYSSYDFLNSKNPLPIVPIRFYTPQAKAGGALVLKPQSYFNIKFDMPEEQNKLLFEFWAKTSQTDRPFLKLMNTSTGETITTLGINKNHILSTAESEENEYFHDCFISNNSWTHYSIFLSNESAEVSIRANDELFMKKRLESTCSLKDLSFQLMNYSKDKSYSFDILRIWDFENDLGLSLLNKHYRNYSADSSKLYVSFDFDEDDSFMNIPSTSNIEVKYNNISHSRSDAPVFSKAPELNVIIYGGFYSVEWQQAELSLAKEFILERSFNGGDFEDIHSVFAEEDLNKLYYYSDEKKPGNEIVYYRLKQINKGGAVVYSSTVKIGQVEQLTFNLEQNFPNPFNPETRITIEMLEQDEVEIYVYDLVGKKIQKLHEGSLGQGRHSFVFNGANLPSGIYFFEAKTPTSSVVRKMILTK